MLPPCSCKNKCTDRIEEEERKVIYHQFWENDYNGRLAWLHSRRLPVPIKRRRVDTKGLRQRNASYQYFVMAKDEVMQTVCEEH